jgi:hypothetical protein
MDSIIIPRPDTIRKRICACEQELRALRRLLRLSVSAETAEEARQQRETATEARADAS